jgi:hypothetical protein
MTEEPKEEWRVYVTRVQRHGDEHLSLFVRPVMADQLFDFRDEGSLRQNWWVEASKITSTERVYYFLKGCYMAIDADVVDFELWTVFRDIHENGDDDHASNAVNFFVAPEQDLVEILPLQQRDVGTAVGDNWIIPAWP